MYMFLHNQNSERRFKMPHHLQLNLSHSLSSESSELDSSFLTCTVGFAGIFTGVLKEALATFAFGSSSSDDASSLDDCCLIWTVGALVGSSCLGGVFTGTAEEKQPWMTECEMSVAQSIQCWMITEQRNGKTRRGSRCGPMWRPNTELPKENMNHNSQSEG
jgi:hypothetical protein